MLKAMSKYQESFGSSSDDGEQGDPPVWPEFSHVCALAWGTVDD